MSRSPFAGRPLQDWIKDLRQAPSPDDRYRALLAVQSLGSSSQQLECCRSALADVDSGIRAQAAKKLRDLRSHVQTLALSDQAELTAALNERLRDDDPDVRFETARTLGQLDPANKSAGALLLALLDDEGTQPLTVSVVVTALGERDDLQAEDLLSRFQKLLSHSQAEVRENVSAVISRWGTSAAPLVSELLQALDDDEPIVRENAAIALGGAGQASDEVLAALRQAATDEDEGVALAAKAAGERLQT
jgi:HEAT repeat protein